MKQHTRRRLRPRRSAPQVPSRPWPRRKPYQVVSPNGSREDEYYWLRDDKRENPEMLAYVKAENAYADAMLAHIKPLETKVYNEIVGRLQQDDSTVPYLMNGYWYFRRYETGKEYPIYSRRAGTLERRPKKSCSTATSFRRATISSRSATSPSAPTASSWPGRKTPSAAANTW